MSFEIIIVKEFRTFFLYFESIYLITCRFVFPSVFVIYGNISISIHNCKYNSMARSFNHELGTSTNSIQWNLRRENNLGPGPSVHYSEVVCFQRLPIFIMLLLPIIVYNIHSCTFLCMAQLIFFFNIAS